MFKTLHARSMLNPASLAITLFRAGFEAARRTFFFDDLICKSVIQSQLRVHVF
jgi:hypothetical protein